MLARTQGFEEWIGVVFGVSRASLDWTAEAAVATQSTLIAIRYNLSTARP
jgi:hypothetical protein